MITRKKEKLRTVIYFVAACCVLSIASSSAEAQFPASKNTGTERPTITVENLDYTPVEIQRVNYEGGLDSPTRINAEETISFTSIPGNNFVIRTAGDKKENFRKFVTATSEPNQKIYVTPTQWVETDELFVTFTSKFEVIYNSWGSGAWPVSIWKPIPPKGFYPLGDFAWPQYVDPNGNALVAVVKEKVEGSGALSKLVKLDDVWDDGGSGGNYNGFVWNMRAPEGYVALGSMCSKTSAPDYSNTYYRCVRKDLVQAARVVEKAIWNDYGSGARRGVSIWRCRTEDARPGYINLSPGTFIAQPNWNKPTAHPAAYILPLRLPQEVMVKEDAEPELTSPDPADIKRIYKYGKLIQKLPWFAVEDTFTPVQKFENSPYYTLERETIYECVKDWTNDSEVEIDKVYEQVEGTTLENAKNFQKTTGISTTLEFEQPGTVLTTGGVSGSITFNQSWEEGWSNRIATTDTKGEKTSFTVSAKTLLAIWQKTSESKLWRENRVQVGKPTTTLKNATKSIVLKSKKLN